MFNEIEKKRLSLPMPALGWRVAVLRFFACDGKEYKLIVDGVKEQSLVRASTAQPMTAGRLRMRSSPRRPRSASNSRKNDYALVTM